MLLHLHVFFWLVVPNLAPSLLSHPRSYLMVDADILTVPVAECTAANLAFYGAELISPSDCWQFEVPDELTNLPMTSMWVGETYAADYILRKGKEDEFFGGAYLEWHDVPHFHMPLDNDAKGILVLGKMVDDKMMMSGFRLKFGTAVYMHPWTLHNDCFLIGKYGCVYASTEHFQTGTVLDLATNKPSSFEFL
jgi:hypothetical protein